MNLKKKKEKNARQRKRHWNRAPLGFSVQRLQGKKKASGKLSKTVNSWSDEQGENRKEGTGYPPKKDAPSQ